MQLRLSGEAGFLGCAVSMLITLLALILAVLLFGAAAVRGAIGKLLLIIALSIGLASLIAWLGKDGFTVMLWVLLVLCLVGCVIGKTLEAPRPTKRPKPNQHTYIPSKEDHSTITFSDHRPSKAEKKAMKRSARGLGEIDASEASTADDPR